MRCIQLGSSVGCSRVPQVHFVRKHFVRKETMCKSLYTYLTVCFAFEKPRWLLHNTADRAETVFSHLNCVTGCAPDNSDSLTDQFIKRSDVSTSTTRSLKKLQIPFLKSATGKRSLYYRTVRIWNALDPLLKLGSTLQESKQKLQSILLIKRLYRQYSVI